MAPTAATVAAVTGDFAAPTTAPRTNDGVADTTADDAALQSGQFRTARSDAAPQFGSGALFGTTVGTNVGNTFSGAALAAASAPGAGTASLASAGDSTPATSFTPLHQLNLGGAMGAAQQLNQSSTVKLAGTPEQWQQPLREALGDRLQWQVQRGNEQATITLDPPNMGRIEISIRHTAGSLQVAMTASHSEVLRQLNAIGDNVRQDLSARNFTDVSVTVAPAPRGGSQFLSDGGGGRQQQGREQDQETRTPGRALTEDGQASSTFAMNRE